MTQAATLAQLASSGALSADTSGNVTAGGSIISSQSITVGTSGVYQAGSLYSDTNWGMIFRAKQASPAQAEFRWANAADTERMRLDASGNLLVGTTSVTGLVTSSQAATSAPSVAARATSTSFANDVVQIYCARDTNNNTYNYILASRPAGVSFVVRDSGNVQNANNSYGSLSDQRLKENIVDATPKLEKLNQVRVVNFNMIGDEQKQIGVVAQELEQIFPNMVEEDQEGIKAVKYSVFVPMLIKAIQELKAELDVCKAEIAALKGV